jgi:YVTN family beta-propeller protein
MKGFFGIALAALILPSLAPQPFTPAAAPVGRVYTADQISNTVSVIDPSSGTLVGTIPLGQPRPNGSGALYREQLGVHGLGVSPDGSLLAVVSVTSNALTLIETTTNRIRGTTYVGRAPHEPAFSPDGREIWVAVRGENYVSVIDPTTLRETRRIVTSDGAAMIAFRPDGRYAFVNSSRQPELDVVDARTYEVVKRVTLPSKFSPNLAVTPDGREVWLTLKDVGRTIVVDAERFEVTATLETGAITNHVNFVDRLAYVTIGGENVVKVYRRETGAPPRLVATVPVGDTPHGVWPSSDNSRVYIGEENADSVAVIDVATQRVIGRVAVGQSPQALVFAGGAAMQAAPGAPLGRSGAGRRIERRSMPVPNAPAAKAKAVIRSLADVDLVDITVRGAPAGAMYDVFAVERSSAPHGRAVKLAHVMVRPDGTAEVSAQLQFFDGRLTGVVLVPAGSLPPGAPRGELEIAMQITSAGHCSNH